jgi:hypothetical protein
MAGVKEKLKQTKEDIQYWGIAVRGAIHPQKFPANLPSREKGLSGALLAKLPKVRKIYLGDR